MKDITPNHTQVPNMYLDQLMPFLSEAELKCLLYISRRTFGFQKRKDRISISQLTKGIKDHDHGTGLSRQAVITATKKLAKAGIIKKIDGRVTEYEVVKNLDPLEVVKNLDQRGLKFRPKLVKNLDPQKKGKKVNKRKGETPQLNPDEIILEKTQKFIEKVKAEMVEMKIKKCQMEEMTKFVTYWTEPNKSKTKLKWELRETWDIRRRIATWLKNAEKFSKNNNYSVKEDEIYQIQT